MQNGIATIPNRPLFTSHHVRAVVTDKPLIAYIRVSISQQGRSGLGIEAQRETLRHTTTLVNIFPPARTGGASDRTRWIVATVPVQKILGIIGP